MPKPPAQQEQPEPPLAEKIAGGVAKGLSLGGKMVKGAGENMPGVLGKIGTAAAIVQDAIAHPSPNVIQGAVCAGVAVVVKGAAAAPLVAPAMKAGAAAGAAAVAGSLNPYVVAGGAAVGAGAGVIAVAPIVNAAVEPVGENARAGCHAVIDFGKQLLAGKPAPKNQQVQQAQQQVADNRANYNQANLHAQRQSYQQVMSRTQCYNLPFNYRQHSPVISSHLVYSAQQNAIWEFRLRYGSVPSWVETQIKSSVSSYASHFSGSSLGLSEFSLSLMATNLISSYNSYHLERSIYSSSGLYGDIGGVASQVSTITDLIDSEAHALADAFYLCFPAKNLSVSDNLFKQIKNELADIYRKHKALPFFSLHFNQNGFLYPILHPAFQNTLIGEIIGLLDYFMKGYLNGGVFDAKFLKMWHETANCDENFLRSKIIDLKKYCKEQLPALGYLSLRELESKYGVKGKQSNSSYQQPFMTSFRIIAYQKKVEREGNILIPHPDFKVEYSIDVMPDYQQYLDAHVRDHGELPPEYKQIRQCYELFAQEIKEKMPQLPFCKDFFQLLGVINSLCYVYTTLDKMGKAPVQDIITLAEAAQQSSPFPKALPPIPVRYYRTYDYTISIKDILTLLSDTPAKSNLLNQQISGLFTSKNGLPEVLIKQIDVLVRQLLMNYLRTQLPPQEVIELNDEDVNRIVKQANQHIISIVNHFAGLIDDELTSLVEEIIPVSLSAAEKNDLLDLPLDKKIATLQARFTQQMSSYTTQWQNLPLAEKLPERKALWTQIQGIVKQAIEINKEIILARKANKAAELAKLTPEQKIQNQANIASFELQINQKIAALELTIQRLEEISKVITPVHSFLKSMLPEKNNPKDFNADHKAEIIKAIQLVQEIATRKLTDFTQTIQNFLPKLLSIKQFMDMPISKKYTHTFLGFTGKALSEKTGDNFQIVGGCGMALPDLNTQPIPHADSFCPAVAAAMVKAVKGKGQFEHNGIVYTVFELPIVDANRATLEEAKTVEPTVTVLHKAAANAKPEDFQALLNSSAAFLLTADQYGNLPIHYAAQAGNEKAVEQMLNKNLNLLESKNHRGQTALMLAVQNGQQAVVEYLQRKNANFNHTLPNGLFPLYMAIQKNFIPMAIWMLNYVDTLDVNKELDSKMTAVHLALQNNATLIAGRLIERGARCDIRRKSDGFTAFHLAAQQGEVELLKKMSLTSVSVNLALESKKTALHLAAAAGQLETVKFLIEKGALVDAQTLDGETPLMLAIKSGQTNTAIWLAEKSAINLTNQKQQTASLLAMQYAQPLVGDVLIRRGEDFNKLDKKGETYLYYLVRNGEYQRFRQLANKVSRNLQINGNTLLAVAAQYGHFLMVYDLLERQVAYISTTAFSMLEYAVMADEIGYLREQANTIKSADSLALLAVKHTAPRCLKFLLQKMPPIACQHQSLLMAAIVGNNQAILSLIFKYCNDINQVDAEGNTLLHIAVKHGAHLALPMLVERGCQFTKLNVNKKTVYHLAIDQEDGDLLKRLLKLSSPKDWPLDLWNIPSQILSAEINKVLTKYKKRLPVISGPSTEKSVSQVANNTKIEAALAPMPILTEPQRKLLKAYESCIDQNKFDKAAQLIERNAFLINVFQSEQGGRLFQQIFSEIKDIDAKLFDLEELKKQAELKHMFSVDRLLATLKTKGITPVKFLGENNVLVAISAADDDAQACFRLKVFTKHFSECLTSLAMDKYSEKTSIMQLVLARNRYGLFEQLDAVCTHRNGLHEAVAANNFDLVVKLLKRYPVNSVDKTGATSLMLATALGNVSLVNVLLQHGATVDQLDYQGRSALHYALSASSELAALTLLPLSKKPNHPDRKGKTPLMLAAAKGMVAIQRFICEAGLENIQSVDAYGRNALHYAALEGQVESILYLLNQGFSINQAEIAKNPAKSTKYQQRIPLHLAALRGHEEAVLRLLEMKANPEQEDANGDALCEYAVLSKKQEVLDLIKLLPYYNNQARNRHLLHVAARVDHVDVLSELILDKVNLNLLDSNGRSALHIACIYNAGSMAELLLSGGDLVMEGLDHQGYSPLHNAALFGHVRLIELLAKAGVNLNQKTSQGDTPLTLAAAKGHQGAVVAFLKLGADMSVTNKAGQTPCQVAQLNQHLSIANRLQMAGNPINLTGLKIHGIYQPKINKGPGARNEVNSVLKK